MWEACVVRQDISHQPGWETGRPSEPDYMELNLRSTREVRTSPRLDHRIHTVHALHPLLSHRAASVLSAHRPHRHAASPCLPCVCCICAYVACITRQVDPSSRSHATPPSSPLLSSPLLSSHPISSARCAGRSTSRSHVSSCINLTATAPSTHALCSSRMKSAAVSCPSPPTLTPSPSAPRVSSTRRCQTSTCRERRHTVLHTHVARIASALRCDRVGAGQSV
jgi:hypothetical protein